MHINILWVLISLNLLLQTPPSVYHPIYSWDRTAGQGKLWLSWTPDRRRGFSAGYLWAYQEGFREACLSYFIANPPATTTLNLEESALQKCKVRQLYYSKGPDYYEAQITAYYEKYRADEDLPITWLFQAFSDQENKSPEEIHRAWTKHEHP